MTLFIGYARVSTDKQGASGLGLEAQEATIRGRIGAGDRLLMPIMVEVESGTRRDRPVLRKALDRCRVTGATLLVAKLDRLARDSAFVADVLRSGIPVEFCDVPSTKGAAGTFHLGMMAQVAQLEAGLIGERTKAALAAAKARGTVLGGDRGHRHTAEEARSYGAAGGAKRRDAADLAALAVADMIGEARTKLPGASLHAIARELNEAGAVTPRGGTWTATAVKRALGRIEGAAE